MQQKLAKLKLPDSSFPRGHDGEPLTQIAVIILSYRRPGGHLFKVLGDQFIASAAHNFRNLIRYQLS